MMENIILFVEFTRNDDRGAVGGLSTSQFIGIFVLAAGLLMYYVLVPKCFNTEEITEEKSDGDES